jgi:ribulose-bisphosphate carboxylase large chain
VALPILAHPAFQGAFVTNPTGGIAHGVAFGLLPRLAGADATIFPNFGGRFSFSRPECLSIAAAARAPLGSLRPLLPSPAGGMTLDRVPEIVAAYGADTILLIGGDLYRHSGDFLRSCHLFRRSVEEASRAVD